MRGRSGRGSCVLFSTRPTGLDRFLSWPSDGHGRRRILRSWPCRYSKSVDTGPRRLRLYCGHGAAVPHDVPHGCEPGCGPLHVCVRRPWRWASRARRARRRARRAHAAAGVCRSEPRLGGRKCPRIGRRADGRRSAITPEIGIAGAGPERRRIEEQTRPSLIYFVRLYIYTPLASALFASPSLPRHCRRRPP